MDQRRAAGALLALVVCITTTAAAPTVSNQTGLDLYDGAPEGCYYNFQHYGEGDRIMTNEPCLNCTCHNRMLMCYLRVCPFTKAIGQDCTVEKRADQCCPIVTCPDVPVDLLTSTSTTSPAEYGATGVGKLDKYGCSISGKYFPEGSKVPPTPNKPCEHCYCIRNMTTCVMQECTLHVDGCTPIYHKDVCCPVRYSCDHPEDTTLLLDDMTTTVRPTPGFLLTTTTLSPVTQMSQDCVHDDQIFPDGALIKTEKACEHCYCMKGDIVCVVQECGTPMENEGKNCTSQPPREGQCCPDTYICEGDEVTMEPFSEFTTQPQLEELTTLSPPRRVGVEGSGYRNEPDSYTEVPSIETEPEGSGYEHLTEQTAVDDNSIVTSESPEISSEAVDVTTVRTPIIEEVERTTEPDKGLNTVPSDEDMFKPSGTEKTPFEEPKVTETPLASVEGSVDSEDITTPEEAFMPVLTTKSDESSSTTETAFRKEDTLGEPTEVYNLGEPEKVSTLATEIEKETEEDVTSSKTKAPFIEELEKQTTLTPEFTHKDIEHETPSKDSTTESILEITTSEIKPVDKITTESVELGQKETTEIPVEKEDEAETTNADQNEVENISTTLPPGRIPGEGDCLLNDITYRNNSNVPSVNNCHTSCRCVSSIIKCDPIICSPPPEYMDNCQPTYDSPDACCPTYVCHTGETMPPQPHSQMSGTDKPLTSSSIECIGEECEIRKDDSVLNTDDCGSTGCVEGHPKKPEQPLEDCHDGKCQESPATNCENGKCGIEPEIVPVQQTPLCENESDCKGAVPEVSSCEGEGCVSGSVGCTGADCSTDITRQPTIPAPEGEKCEGDCKTPETIEPCTEQPCRRKETGDVGSYLPPGCSGSECTQPQIPSKGDDVNEMSTELPFTDDTDIKSTQQPEMTTVRHEIQTESAKTPDITEHQPTEMDDLAIREGSTMQPYEAESLGTEPSSQLVHDAVTKSPHNIEEDLSTSEPQPSVSDETRIRDIDATTKEPQDLATKSQEDILTVTEPQDVTSKVDSDLHKPESTEPSLHSESTESPQDVESHDARTTVAQEYSTSTPENQDKQTGSAEHGELYTESPEQKPTAENEATEEPHTSEIDPAITKLPISDITEPHETEITDLSIHDLTESNEIDDKATKAPESVEQEIQITTETFQHELTTEQIMLATESQEPSFGTSHVASTEKDIKLPFTNAPVDLDTGITESVTKQSSEASTPKATENISDVTSSIPDLYKTEKQETYTESPAESVTESQESSTKQSVLSEIKPMQTESPEYTTDELVKESEVPVSDDDKKIQTTEATVKPSQEATTHTAISEEKTTLSEPTQAPVPLDVEKQQATESPETNEITQDTAQAASEKPATVSTLEEHHVEEPDSKTTATDKTATETSDKHATEKPSQIPEDGFKTDEPESITEYSQEITEQPEISTEEPSIVEAPVKDEMPSEPYIPVHPEIASEFATAQPDINNEIPDVEPDVGDAETETKVPEQLGTEIPDVKTPSPDTKVEGTQQPEVYTETPVIEEVDRDDHAKPAESETTKVPEDFVTNKTLEAVTTTLPKIVEDLEMTVSTEATEQPESAITEKVIDQTAESEPEKPSEHETLSTISVTQVTTIPSILAQESSEQPAEPVVTESGVSYATSVPESHVKEQDETVTQTSETNTYKPHDMVEPQEEVVTEGSTDIPSNPPEEKPLKEKPDADHDDKHEDKTGLPQGTRTPDETSTALLETVTEPAEEDISGKPQEPQKEETLPEDTATEKADKEVPSRTQSPDELTTGPSTGLDTVVTEPTQHKVTEAQVDKEISTISLGEQEKTTYGSQDEITESPTRIPQEVTEISSDVTEKYTEIASQDDLPDSVTVTPEGADISSSNEVTTEKPLEEDIESRLTTQKTPEVIDMATLPQHQATEGPMVYDTQEPEKESTTDTPVSPTEETVGDEHTTPDVIELQEHSHIPTEDITTVSPAEEEKQTTETDKISKPSDEYSPEPHHTSPPQIDESETDTVVPTTNQPDMQIGDQRFGEDASQEEKEKPIQPIPGSEQSPVSDTEIPVQTERVPIETVTESELLHETAMLEVLTTSTSAKEEDESSTQKPEYVKPEERPLQEKPEKPIDEPAEKPLEEPIEKPLETSTSETPSEKPEIQPSEELEEPTETPLDEKTTELADDKPFKEEVPTETPEPKPLDMADEKPLERPSEDTDVKTEQKPEPGAEVTPQESFEEKPQDESEEKPLKSPEEKPQEAPEETPLETPEKTPQETAEKKPEVSGEQPQEAPEEKPQEVPEKKPQEAPQEQPEEMPEENPQEVSGEKPQGVPDKTEEKPQETPEEIPETPEKKPQEVPEEKPEIPEEKPQEVPEEKPQPGPEDKPEILEEEPQKIPEEKPQEAAEEKPETPDEKPQEVPGEKPQEAAEEKPETPEETPQELSGEKPQETAEKEIETPEEKPQGVPGEKPQEAAEKEPEAPEEKPQEVPGEKPQEAAEEKPETPAEKPQELPEEKPEIPEDKPQETTEGKPQEIPDKVAPEEKPLEMPEEKPQEETKEKPQETPEDKPETPEEMPQDVFEEKPQEAPEDKPETPKEKPQEVPKEEPEIPEEKPQEAAEEIPQKTPEKIPDTPEEKPQVVPEEKPEIPEEKPQDVIEGKPEEQPETPEEKPQEVPKEKPQKEPEEKPETPQEKPQEVLKEKPQETPEEKPEMPEEKPVMTEEKPQEKPEEKPEMPEEKPQESPEEKPQEPEKKPQEEPEERPQEVPEQKPQEIPEEKPAEPASTTSPEITKPGLGDMLPTEEVPDDEGQFPPSGGTSGYGTEPDYVEEDQAFGPGTCRYGGKVYVSAQQIPRDDPCDFCFCFRSDIICLQQSCPPPIHGCHEEPIQGFCCPRYECPVAMATTLNVTTTTTTTTTTLPPHFLPHAYKGAAQRRGCQIKGHTYKVGEVVRASSGPCLHCTCGGDGQMKCDPKACTPEPMLRQMIAAAVSAKRRR